MVNLDEFKAAIALASGGTAAETAQHYEIEWGKHVQLYRQLAQDVLVR